MTDNHTDEVDLELERLRRELTEWRDNARYRCVWCDWTGPSSAEDAREHRRGCEAWLDAIALEGRGLRRERDNALRERDDTWKCATEQALRLCREIVAARVQLTQIREECARLCEEHDSSLARLGGGLHDSDRRILKQRGQELAAAIRALAAALSPKKETT